MKLTLTCLFSLTTTVLVIANDLADHELTDLELSARARRMLQAPVRACVNPTCASPPCAAQLLGDVGCTTVSGVAEYNHGLVRKGETIAANAHIYGPFEAGFTERQQSIIRGWGCTDPSVAYDSVGGKDIGLAERETAYKCNIEFPRVEGDTYIGVVGKCGGHTHDYHFHRSFSCVYKEEGGHSTAVGNIGDHRIYGKWEDYSKKLLPLLDACGGHWGPTPDCEWCYHYHVQDKAPFTVGCMGPAADGGLVSINTCRALYGSKCGDATETIAVGNGEAVQYDRFCPCYDADGSNVGTKELPALSTKAIAVHAETGELVGDSSAAPTTAAAPTAQTTAGQPDGTTHGPTTGGTGACAAKASRTTCTAQHAAQLGEECRRQLAKACHQAGMGFGRDRTGNRPGTRLRGEPGGAVGDELSFEGKTEDATSGARDQVVVSAGATDMALVTVMCTTLLTALN